MVTRVCIDCLESKDLGLLVKNSGCLHGVRKLCKACQVIRVKNRVSAEDKATYDRNRRASKLEEIRAYDRKRSKLPHRKARKREGSRRRKLVVSQQMPLGADKGRIKEVYEEAVRMSRETGIPHEVDHIIPLRGKLISGLHTEGNLRVVTATENQEKSNHFQLTWEDYPK